MRARDAAGQRNLECLVRRREARMCDGRLGLRRGIATIGTAEMVILHSKSRPMTPAILTRPTSRTPARNISFRSNEVPQLHQQRRQHQPTPTNGWRNS